MKLLAASLLSLGLGLAAVSASQAMPVAPLAPSQAEVIKVAQGCGPGFHRGPGGHCRPLLQLPAWLAYRPLRQALPPNPPLVIGRHAEGQGSQDPRLFLFQ
jgi:hypothetical protein